MGRYEYIAGIDLGGTFTKIGLLDRESLTLVDRTVFPTPRGGPYDVVCAIRDAVVNMMPKPLGPGTKAVLVGAGIGCPGQIDSGRGVVVWNANMEGFSGFALGSELSARLNNVPVVVENDANAAVLGEQFFGGAARGSKHVIAITLGTGVGGGIITHGVLLSGSRGFAGELGHVVVDPAGPLCDCGNRGCLETFCSASAISRQIAHYQKKFPDCHPPLREPNANLSHCIGAPPGDALARVVLTSVVETLGVALANFAAIFDPEVIVVGGGVAEAGPEFLSRLKDAYQRAAMRVLREDVVIELSSLGADAAILGAAGAVLAKL